MSKIEFNADAENWVMILEDGKILFNREKWPDSSPDDFALAVIEILERAHVSMEKWPVKIDSGQKND